MSRTLWVVIFALTIGVLCIVVWNRMSHVSTVSDIPRVDTTSPRTLTNPITMAPTSGVPLTVKCPGHGQMALVVKDSEDNVIFSIGCN